MYKNNPQFIKINYKNDLMRAPNMYTIKTGFSSKKIRINNSKSIIALMQLRDFDRLCVFGQLINSKYLLFVMTKESKV